MKEKKQSTMKRLMIFAGRYKFFSYAAQGLAFISAWVALIPFYSVWKILKELLAVRPYYMEAEHIIAYGWEAVGFSLLAMALYIASLMCSHAAAFRVQSNMRKEMMEHVMKLPLGYIEKTGSGKIKKIINESAASTETFLAHNLPDRVVSKATPMGLLLMMIYFDWRLGLISLIPALLAFVLMATMMMGPKLASDMKEYQNALETMSNEAVEYIRGIPIVKTFGQTIFSFKRFKNAIDTYEKWTLDFTKAMMVPMIGFTTFANGIFVALIIATFLFAKNMNNTFILHLFFYLIITSVLTTTLMKMAYAGESQLLVEDALKRMDDLLLVKPLESPTKKACLNDSSIQIDNISFSYEDTKENAIDQLSMEIQAGEHIALVGPSGGGKTTLVSLIARFWDVKSGNISIGGVNVKDIPNEQLMNTISYVFQDSKLLKMSILDNIRMGRDDASEEEVMDALKKAMCMDIIDKLPDGIHTMIGSKGTFVSGGEMQRLSIARAFLKKAPILILDEATAYADPDNESYVQQAFENLSKEKTVILIAHRLSTITNVNRIYVLKEGKIVESGNHTELVQKNGLYQHMWREYNQSVDWQIGKE